MEFSPEKAKQLRLKAGLGLKRAAALIGVKHPAICQWEAGVCRPDATNLGRAALSYNCAVDDFFVK